MVPSSSCFSLSLSLAHCALMRTVPFEQSALAVYKRQCLKTHPPQRSDYWPPPHPQLHVFLPPSPLPLQFLSFLSLFRSLACPTATPLSLFRFSVINPPPSKSVPSSPYPKLHLCTSLLTSVTHKHTRTQTRTQPFTYIYIYIYSLCSRCPPSRPPCRCTRSVVRTAATSLEQGTVEGPSPPLYPLSPSLPSHRRRRCEC